MTEPVNAVMLNATVDDFCLPSTDAGGTFDSARDGGGRSIVLYFYPKDDTPGCAIEGSEFSGLLAQFESAGAVVVGVSRDDIASHRQFRGKFDYQHHLLSDSDGELAKAFGALRGGGGVARCTFLISPARVVAGEWRDIKEVRGHAQAVLDAARQLQSA